MEMACVEDLRPHGAREAEGRVGLPDDATVGRVPCIGFHLEGGWAVLQRREVCFLKLFHRRGQGGCEGKKSDLKTVRIKRTRTTRAVSSSRNRQNKNKAVPV